VQDELHVSADDLAVTAAKEKLAALAGRPGYREAMKPRATGSRRAMWILLVVGVGFFALAQGSCTYVSSSWLRVAISGVFVLLGVFTWFLALGAAGDPPADAWPVVVLDKVIAGHQLSLLRDNGSTQTVTTNDALHAILRTGDVGVAHVRVPKHAAHAVLVAFHRL
jgi:hypothetical protein